MPRKRRHRKNYNEPGHAHELTFSCFHRYKFLNSDRSCQWLCDSLNAARAEFEFDLWAFVFMPEHAHLIIRPRRLVYDMAEIREAIKHPVAKKGIAYLRKHAPEWLARIAKKKGDRVRYHFWQEGGGYDRNIDEPRTLMKMIEYTHMNPERRRLVERATDWKWSSAAYSELGNDPPICLDPIPPEWLTA